MTPPYGYYASGEAQFRLHGTPEPPAWRAPQLGALGALLAHWSLSDPQPALVSLPTGTGKTGVALAAPHLLRSRRVLVIAPSTELRRQLAAAFASEDVLFKIAALQRRNGPRVLEVTGRVDDWSRFEDIDVAVGLPHSVSPLLYPQNPPPPELFDLVVIDEAHHAPAKTWRALLDHFERAHRLLLTATPRRRDGQRVPGKHVYHYPLRQALREGVFKPVVPRLLDMAAPDRDVLDSAIANEVAGILADPVHAHSTLMVRASSRHRAAHLVEMYRERGVDIDVLHSGLSNNRQREVIAALRGRELRAVAVVGMLIEGFDLPSLRVIAYHDKHKSLPATAQLIGRLARVDDRYPQPSVLVTVRDVDVYPELQGVLRDLYEEDEDWATLLPGILDDEIAEEALDREYAATFTPSPPQLALDAVHPLRRAVVFEVPPDSPWTNPLGAGVVPDALQAGAVLRGQQVLYSGVNQTGDMLIVVTSAIVRPPWHDDPGLDSPTYALHAISVRQPAQPNLPSLILVNTPDRTISRQLLDSLGAATVVTLADPARMQDAFDGLDRVSVSSVGVRTTYASAGTPSYRMFAGKSVERGLRDADTAFGALGHAMAQVEEAGSTFTAGVATGKGKYWETRYVPLRKYDAFVTWLSEQYWYPSLTALGRLLPQVARGRRLLSWPDAAVLAVELDVALVGTGWRVRDAGPIERLDLRSPTPPPTNLDPLPLELVSPTDHGDVVVWRGEQDITGTVNPIGDDVPVTRGFAGAVGLSELLSTRPPTIFFLDGTTVHGSTVFDGRESSTAVRPDVLRSMEWTNVDIRAETRSAALSRAIGVSVHEALEGFLTSSPRRARRRWVICNDGKGEIADYLVVEADLNGAVFVDLWHAKAAHGDSPSIRVSDFEEVVAQAIKSRRWLTNVGLWEELGDRLTGRATPAATVVEGDRHQLEILCGVVARWRRASFAERRPIVTGQVGIAQPGLSLARLSQELAKAAPDVFATQIRDLLTVLHDSVALVAPRVTVLCSE